MLKHSARPSVIPWLGALPPRESGEEHMVR
jgi:hypothetical protein